MTAALDPLATTERITEHYLRYLRTTFAPNDPALRRAFEVALRDGIRLTRGPYLEATAPFRPGASVRDLVSEGVLSPELLRLSDDAVPLDRPLHGHQDTAIRKAVAGRRNLVVSTGTGSGKTETFLLPILDHLGREIEAGTIGTPGVRALLLYPMNALANDQVKRLRTLLADYPEITFGRFVGETKERPGDAADDFAARFPGEKRPVNELISRAEMRQTPPHILLTNYAMLEYLLLRPSDSPFFDGLTAGSWRFVVLDEAHVYGGAQGTEMAMLLRRLRDRIARSEPGRMQCFATSATLGSGEEDHPELVRFAGNLFDERFEWEADDAGRRDVVTATRRALAAGAGGHALPLAAYHRLRDAYRRGASTVELAAITADAGSAAATPAKGEERGEDEAPAAYLGRLLTDDARVLRLQAALDVRPVALRDAVELVGDGATAADVVALVDLCVAARRRDDDAPLLPARYHFFVRSLEGAFACFHPAHPAEEPALLLARHAHCPACEGAGVRSAMVELATCRRCGAAYAVGEPHRADERRLATAGERAERLVHLALDVAAAEQVDDEDAAALDIDGPEGTAVVWLGLESGVLHEREPGTEPTRRALRVDHGGDVLRSCVACGNRTNGEIVRRFLTGQDAPVSVIATDLYQQLPAAQDSALADEVGEGRKLLTFSDSRQDAAFFASYLERTYGRAVERGVLHGALRELDDGDPVMVEDLAARAHKVGERALVLDPEPRARRGNRRAAASWVMSEVLALDRRQSLDGLGLAEISVITPRRYEPPAALVRLGFTPAQAVDLLQLLLETIRLGGAVTAPDDVDLHDDRFAPRNHELGVRLEGSEGGVISWLPTKGENRRVEIVRKALAAVRSDADPIEVLRGIWRHLTDESSQWPALAAWQKRRHGRLWRLDHTYLELRLRDDDHRPHRCDACGALTWRTVAGICPAWRCDGRVEPDRDDDALEQNHYVRLYRDLLPMGMAVEEHTAQWTATEASRIQEDFIRGRVNVLSCSTTFELGVDVGDVSAVLLRNVPPLAANYIQRAGRAGRRTGAAALVVTYAQRRSHDRAHYEDPTTMVAGTIDPPIVALDNVPIARRHLHSVAFAAHQRHLVGAGGEAHRRVEDFFTPVAGHEHTGDAAFVSWLRSRPESLREALERILPTPIAEAVDVAGWGWVDALATETADEPSCGWLRRAGDEVRDDLGRLDTMIDEAFDERDGRRGDRLSATRRTLAQRQLLGFLASRNVLPKYGFPVDVVPLDVASGSDGDGTAAKLELDRDLSLAIADYAPGAEVVAAKTRWRSAGLRKLPDRELPVYHWRLCADCGGFASALEELTDTCECGGTTTRDRGTFIRPEFGFVGRRAGDAGESRPRRRALVRTWFGAYRHEPPAFEWVAGLDGPIKVRSRTSRQGRINVVNSGPDGRRFRICDRCGHGEPTPAAAPRTASGSRRVAAGPDPHDDLRRPGRACAGTMRSHALGHEYLTDVTELRLERPLTEPVARSVLYALLEGVPALGVARADVDGTLHRSATDGARSLVLFDAVPGGAGYAQLLAEQLPRLFQAALRRVTSCECGPETACYSCLWNYRNQPFHEELARGDAAIVLSDILGDGVTRT